MDSAAASTGSFFESKSTSGVNRPDRTCEPPDSVVDCGTRRLGSAMFMLNPPLGLALVPFVATATATSGRGQGDDYRAPNHLGTTHGFSSSRVHF